MGFDPGMRAMLDTMVFDALDADPDGLLAVRDAVRHRRLQLLSTPVQEAQLAAVPDPARRKRLQRAIPREAVPAVGLVGAGGRHDADNAILDTTHARADVLVTEDRRLAETATSEGVTVWHVADLVRFARAA